MGTFSSLAVHFLEWKDTSPTPMAAVAADLGKTAEALSSQEKLVDEAKQGRQQDENTGLDPETQAPFFDMLEQEAVGEEKLEGKALDDLCTLTVELVDHIQQEIGIVGFWKKTQAQDGLRGWIFMALDDADLLPFDRLDPVTDKLMELTKANHQTSKTRR